MKHDDINKLVNHHNSILKNSVVLQKETLRYQGVCVTIVGYRSKTDDRNNYGTTCTRLYATVMAPKPAVCDLASDGVIPRSSEPFNVSSDVPSCEVMYSNSSERS